MFNKQDFIKNKIKKYYSDKRRVNKQIQIYTDLREDDVIYKIFDNLANRINDELKKRNVTRKSSYMELLGCKPEELKIYLEKKFQEGMSYDNYGKWQVDHIFPISKVDFDDNEKICACFHYKNLQPLWSEENRKKFNKT